MRHEAIDVRMMGARHETIDAQKRGVRHETIDEPRVSRLMPPRVSGLTSHAQWPKVKLGDAPITIIDGDRGKNYPKQNELFASGYCLFLSAENVTRQGFRFDSNKFITIQKDSVLRNGKLARFDIILTTRGTLGNVALYGSSVPFENVRINSGMLILRCDTQKLLPNFLLYVLRSEDFISQVNGFKSGVAQPQLPIKDLKQIQIPLPPLPVQRRIADILSAYDDLIENNRRRIAILEETARLAYRKWFGGMEEGRTATLGEIADVVMGQSPESKTYNDNGEGLPFHQGVTGFGFRYPRDEMWCTAGTRFAEEGDILFSVRAPVGRINVAGERIVIGRGLSAMRAKNGFQSWLLYALKHHFSKEDMIGVGCIFVSTTKKELLSVELPFPLDEEIAAFEQIAGPIDAQIKALSKQNVAIAAARDMLLPRLMKGELIP